MIDAAEAIPDWAHSLSADEWGDPDEDEDDDPDRLPRRGRRRRRHHDR